MSDENAPVIDPEKVDADVEEMIEDGLDPINLSEIGLPRHAIVEHQALVAVQNIKDAYHVQYALAANRAVKNTDEVNRLDRIDRAARTTLARIKRDYPEAIKLAKQFITEEAEQVRKNRDNRG